MDYEQLRHFADSWGLVFMVILLVCVVGWTFRPGASKEHDEASMIPLRDEEAEE